MLIGRFAIMIPALALGGCWRPRTSSRLARHLPHRQRRCSSACHRRDRDHRRPDLLPRRLARPDRRAAQPRKVLLMTDMTTNPAGATAAGRPTRPVPTAWPRPGPVRPRDPRQALVDAFKKLDPRVQVKNPVMFVVLVGTVVTFIEAIAHPGIFAWSITIWLFLTVIFANFAEAMAEGRGKAQADTLRDALGDRGPPAEPRRHRGAGRRGRRWPRATSSSARPATSSPPTARSSRASPRSTSRRSPVSRRR
jgi:hypothetical protein